jgi:hypothetical protein
MDFNRLFWFVFTPTLTGLEPSSAGSFMLIMSFVLLPFCAFVYLILAALNHVGIFITTKTSKSDTELVMKKFGDHFLQYFKGFTGVATIMGYVLVFGKYIIQGVITLETLPPVIFSVGMPFVLAMLVFPAIIICERRMFGGNHSLKSELSRLTDITDEINELELKYRMTLTDLERKLAG